MWPLHMFFRIHGFRYTICNVYVIIVVNYQFYSSQICVITCNTLYIIKTINNNTCNRNENIKNFI